MKTSRILKNWKETAKLNWIRDREKTPKDLTPISRKTIRHELSRKHHSDIRPLINLIPLPPTIKSYLKFEPEIEEVLNENCDTSYDPLHPPLIHLYGPSEDLP